MGITDGDMGIERVCVAPQRRTARSLQNYKNFRPCASISPPRFRLIPISPPNPHIPLLTQIGRASTDWTSKHRLDDEPPECQIKARHLPCPRDRPAHGKELAPTGTHETIPDPVADAE